VPDNEISDGTDKCKIVRWKKEKKKWSSSWYRERYYEPI